jgi:hypothetical protein
MIMVVIRPHVVSVLMEDQRDLALTVDRSVETSCALHTSPIEELKATTLSKTNRTYNYQPCMYIMLRKCDGVHSLG